MNNLNRVCIVVGLLFLATGLAAMPPTNYEQPINDNSRSWDNETYINAGNILMFVTNHGNFGGDVSVFFGKRSGTYYPYVSLEDIESGLLINTVLYSAGLWVGGKVNNQIRIAIAEYDDEYVPGPMESGTHMPDDPSFKVYKLYRDSLAFNPNSDYLNWPVDQGAPVDELGSPIMLGDQMLWTVFNDADTACHQNDAGGTDPLGIEVQQTVWAYDTDEELQNVIFMRYKLYNKGANVIEDAYISLWSDPDLGEPSDDLVGCDTLNDLFFCYNSDNDDAGHYGSTPPALGFKVLTGPVVPSPGDTADFDGTPMPGYKNLGMTSFSKYINGTDPIDRYETYNYMRGLSANGTPYIYGGQVLSYMHSGDPVTGSGDLDFDPSDRRGMGSFGPLSFNPGDSQYVLIKMAIGRGANRLESITLMKEIMDTPEPQVPTLKTATDPHPISIMMLNAINPIEAVIIFGYDADGPRGRDFDYGTLVMTDLPPIDSMVIAADHPEFNGEVVRFYFPLAELLTPYAPLFDSTVHAYSVTGTYADYEPFSFNTSVVIHGHRLGDLNLDGQVDISDLVFMIDYFFTGGPAPELLETADLDQSGTIDISDLMLLIDFMFGQ